MLWRFFNVVIVASKKKCLFKVANRGSFVSLSFYVDFMLRLEKKAENEPKE